MLTQSEVARRLGLNMTSTYRYINTLVELGYLEKDPKSREIRPALMSMLLSRNLKRAANHLELIKEVVDQIHAGHNISIEVALAVDDSLVRLYNREAEETFTYKLPDSTKNCLHNTALGKAFLASLSEQALAEKLEGMELVGKTSRTISDKGKLAAEVAAVRQRGFATSDQEYLDGLLSIAAPLIDSASGVGLGAVSFDFSTLQHDLPGVEQKFAGLVVEAGEKLSSLLPSGKN